MTGSLVTPALRQRVRGAATPIAVALGRVGMTPNALTVIGFLGSCVAAVAASQQAWLLSGLLVLAFGVFDLFDGALARATDQVSRFGAFLDSTLDRAGEAITYVGIGAGLAAAAVANAALLAGAAMAAAFMVSYTRAKAESLGFSGGGGMAAVGVMPREVRLVILTIGLVAAGLLGGGTVALEAALVLIALGATFTAIQRILAVAAQRQAKEG